MNYKETLAFAREAKIDIIMLDVANELECLLQNEITDNDFERLCIKIEEAYLKSDTLSVCHITNAVVDLMTDNSIDTIIKMDKWTIIDKATGYV